MIGCFLPLFIASTLTLKEAESIALKANTAILFAEQDVKQHNYQRIQSLLSWLPDIKFGSMYAKLQKSQKISSHQRQTHLFSNQFELIQPIFSPSLLGDLNLSKIAYEGSRIASETTMNEVLLQIRSLYLALTVKLKKLEQKRQHITYLTNAFEAERKKENFGTGTNLKANQAKAALSQEITQYYNMVKEGSDAKLQLLLMLHLDPVIELNLESSISLDDYPLLSQKLQQLREAVQSDILNPANLDQPLALFSNQEIEEWVMQARRHRPELKKSQLYVQAANEKSRQSKTQYLPTISAFADYGYYQPVNGQFFRQRNDFAGGVQLSWSLFDSFKREAKVLEIVALKKAAGLAFQFENERIELTIRNDLHHIEEALFTYLAADDQAQLARQALEETEVRRQSGSATDLDLQSAQQLFLSADLKNLEAESALLESYFRLRYDTGLDLKEK